MHEWYRYGINHKNHWRDNRKNKAQATAKKKEKTKKSKCSQQPTTTTIFRVQNKINNDNGLKNKQQNHENKQHL